MLSSGRILYCHSGSLAERDDLIYDPLEALQEALVLLSRALLHADYRNRFLVHIVTDSEGVYQLLAFECLWKVLFVGQYHYGDILRLIISEHTHELVPGICELSLVP